MNILIAGASKGLGKAFAEGLPGEGDLVVGISRNKPQNLQLQAAAKVEWICVDMSDPVQASNVIEVQAPAELDV
ncbi:MAG: SDR family NAD(P)-dependent oxidoreductase, partial [Pseudomonadota bacterium]